MEDDYTVPRGREESSVALHLPVYKLSEEQSGVRDSRKGKKMNCKNCGKPIRKRTFHWSNQVAVDNGYCWMMCMFKHLGAEKAWNLLSKGSKNKCLSV